MRVLVTGANGFVGRNVVETLSANHEVFAGTRDGGDQENSVAIDLSQPETILEALKKVRPDAIVQCAGVVENTEAAEMNPVFTRNLLEQVIASGIKPKRIVISGSAAEYGEVDPADLPVKETAELKPTSPYRKSKVDETKVALDFRDSHGLPVVVARIFNPIGPRMHAKFLTSRVVEQVKDFNAGKRDSIEVSRLDSKRDYINVRDLARGIQAIMENEPKHSIYNLGSGESTSNGELVETMLRNSQLSGQPKIVETSPQPEPSLASQADISRMKNEFGWEPSVKLEDTVKEIMNGQR